MGHRTTHNGEKVIRYKDLLGVAHKVLLGLLSGVTSNHQARRSSRTDSRKRPMRR